VWVIPVFLGVTFITFMFLHMLPGDPFSNDSLPPETRDELMKAYGLDKPWYIQYLVFLANFIRGDWGVSFQQSNRPVSTIIGEHIFYSVELAILAFIIILIVGIPLGIIAALNHNKLFDYVATGITLFFYSIPSFVMAILALMLILLANTNFGWTIPLTRDNPSILDLIIPGIILGIRPASIITRLTRSSMLEVLHQDYIRTAWAKGLGQRIIIIRHTLKNGLIPVITVLGDELGQLVVGSVTIETVFAVPGIGAFLISSIKAYDYPLVMIITVLYALIVVTLNLCVDIIYGILDPRIKYTTRRTS
jgi:ABC-type dipeptide/oligopeptide/nickel transport system permease component